MELSQADVAAVAKLARLGLTSQDLELYKTQLSEVLGYVAALQDVDTSEVADELKTAQPNAALADDTAVTRQDTERLVAGVPQREGAYIKVKAVFTSGA